ncbi:ATP-binding cassette sub-family C member 4-like [Culicoides brevitarsis]|uniref:ATP-binding cassette sub-family C member 4-like n=1 Tax=Culicoides brevitarsis TaxID=469753 RepID=UPI00307B1913
METTQKPLKPNPREKANFLSLLTFWWTIDFFKLGYRKVIEFGDLFKPLQCDHSEVLGNRLEHEWFKEVQKNQKSPSLIKALAKTFWKEYTISACVQIFNELFLRIAQPLVLGRLLLYFKQEPGITSDEALYYTIALVCLNCLNAICVNQYILGAFHNGMKVRVAICSAVYRKALRLSKTALGDTSPGKVINLLSNDVNRFDIVSVVIHHMWSAPLLAVIVGYLLYREDGYPGLIGMFVIFFVVPLQSYTGKLASQFRLQTALRTDERVRLMDEIISGIQVIKYYAWEVPFAKLIRVARKMELRVVRKSSYVRALYMTFMLFTTRMALFATMLAIVVLGDELTASKVYVTAAYYAIISSTMSQMWVRGVAEIAEAFVSIKRIKKFLEYEEKESEKLKHDEKYLKEIHENGDLKLKTVENNGNSDLPPKIALSMRNVTAKWDAVHEQGFKNDSKIEVADVKDESRLTLDSININIPKGKLIGVVGAVGAGKSSLLQAILRELPLISGSISYSGDISYASQEAWIFASTVRQNILFGQEMNKERYDAVVKVCALLKDFEQLPFGDLTIVGERGTALSGGQKARISLARAVYRKADIYLLDDPLSAVDAHVGRHLFEECIGHRGRLGKQRATRILVTHQVHYLKDADVVVVLKEGKIEHMGSPQELSRMGIDFSKMLESEEYRDGSSEVDEQSKRGGSRTGSRSRKSSVTSSGSQSPEGSLDGSDDEDDKKVEQQNNLEESSKGKVQGVFRKYLAAGSHPICFTLIFGMFFLTQAIASTIDWWSSYWTSQEEWRNYLKLNETQLENANDEGYASHFVNYFSAAIAVLFNEPEPLSSNICAIIHGSLLAALFLFALTRSITFYNSAVRSSQKLHDEMFKGVVGAPMRFFDTNPSGRILNRFSKDCGATDEFLPKAILDSSQILLNMSGAIIVTAIVNYYYIIPIAVLAIVFQLVRKIYLRTSKNVKRLESIVRSPVFTHLAVTLNGLPIIRAFGTQEILTQEFDALQDAHSAAWYMFIVGATAFGFMLDLMCLIFFAVVTFSFLVLPKGGDQVGLAITQVMALTGMMQWGVRQSAEVSNQLMSVERILEYKTIAKEKEPEKAVEVAKDWPTKGSIEFRKVSYRYHEEGELVLKDLEFEVKSGEKIGIVGRTGAGKSSLIGVLFRIALVEGEVIIDGIDTSRIPLRNLRQKISIIPQDPVLFSGTLRRNLDPFEEFQDSSLWKALEEVELKDIASGPLGLQSAVAAGGSNFSVGQRQLLCLARAILRNNRILVLDEATANVDPHTDELIQLTIRRQFAHCTVLTVAHRLHTIMDSDRVLVMDAGRAEEFGPPHEILQLPAGIFREMVESTGPQESANLMQIARLKYEMKI